MAECLLNRGYCSEAGTYAESVLADIFGTGKNAAADAVSRLRDREWLYITEKKDIQGVLIYDASEYRILLLAGKDNEVRTVLLNRLKDIFAEEYTARINVLASDRDLSFYEEYGFEQAAEKQADMTPMEYLLGRELIGKTVHVEVDHPYGSFHPSLADTVYPVNTGYVILGEEMTDAYIIGPKEPLDSFAGTVCAVIYRRQSDRPRLAVIRTGELPDRERIIHDIGFEEQYYETRILWE